jgi:hypothetical protein
VVQITSENFNTCAASTGLFPAVTLAGPISGVFGEVPGSNPSCSQSDGFKRIVVRNTAGQQVTVTSTIGSSFPFRNPQIVSISRVDGQPDDCGSPPPDIPTFPPEGVTIPIEISYENNEGDTVIELGDLTFNVPIFAPVGIVNAPIYAPITIETPDFNLNGRVEISPEFNVEVSPGGGDNSPGSGDDPSIPENPDDAPSTEDDGRNERLIGVFVRSQQGSGTQTTEINQDDAPDLYVPRLANVYFRVRANGSLGWQGPVDVKTTSAWIPVPANSFAIAARADWERGWSGTVTEVFDTVDFGA